MKTSDQEFILLCQQSKSMAHVAALLGVHWSTFKKRALKLGCFFPNPSGKGTNKPIFDARKIDLNEILSGKHPSYQTYKLKNRLIAEGIKTNKCEVCSQEEIWNNKLLNMELDHIDGNRTNHRLENLRIICPNCHAQTDTYRSKKRQ